MKAVARFVADFGPRHREAIVEEVGGQYEVIVGDESQATLASVLITRNRGEALGLARRWIDDIVREPAA